MKCGACHGNHDSIDKVRACYGMPPRDVVSDVPGSAKEFDEPLTTSGEGKRGQYEFLQDLLSERDMTLLPPYEEASKKLTKADASRLISHLINNIPRAETKAAKFDLRYYCIPAGCYAVPSRTGNNDLDFWQVDVPEEGRWKGYTFVKRVVGGQPSINVKRSEAVLALQAIKEYGIEATELLFRWEIGTCRYCGRHLTRRIPRYNGQGNDCAEQRGLKQMIPPEDWRPEIQDEVA